MREKHPYHCVMCGEQLEEAGMGALVCPKCEMGYIPTQQDTTSTLIWITEREPDHE